MSPLQAALLALALVLVAVYTSWTAGRLDRLHARVDAAWAALDAAMVRRAAAARAVVLHLPPRAPHLTAINSNAAPAVRPPTNEAAASKRIGPDTGSSEVQIAILTAKIKTLADFLSTRGKGDKHNKRNLRLLVHRRQKLLQYLRRKERGGPRWQHCIETLGLTEGTWKGEISL